MNIEVTEPLLSARPVPARSANEERGWRNIGYFYAAAGAVLFSTKAVIVKLAYGINLDPELCLRCAWVFRSPFIS